MSIIICTIGLYALGVITGLLITFAIELLSRKPHERNQPFSKLIPKQEGVVLETTKDFFEDFDNNYDSSRDPQD